MGQGEEERDMQSSTSHRDKCSRPSQADGTQLASWKILLLLPSSVNKVHVGSVYNLGVM